MVLYRSAYGGYIVCGVEDYKCIIIILCCIDFAEFTSGVSGQLQLCLSNHTDTCTIITVESMHDCTNCHESFGVFGSIQLLVRHYA